MNRHIGGAAHGGAPDIEVDDDVERAYRAALAQWASGVTVVSVRDEPHVFGITVTAFASVSLDPPMVLVCLGSNAVILPILDVGTQIVVNILGAHQQRTAAIFTDVGPLGRDLFPPDGAPVIADSLASLICTIDALHRAGDHMVVIARVRRVHAGDGGHQPLVRYDRAWRRLE